MNDEDEQRIMNSNGSGRKPFLTVYVERDHVIAYL
jgi:hypothetical protein